MPKISIATAQCRVTGSPVKNGFQIRKLIRKGKLKGADLIHFCEGSLSGYSKKDLVSPEKIKFNEIRSEIIKIQTLCKELEIWAVFGCAHQLSQGHRPHNSMYVISSDGEIVNRYDKRKCSQNELNNWYTPGFDSCYFEVNDVKFGCALCIEIQFPELFTQFEKDNIHCLLFSTYSKEEMYGIQAQGYAASNNYWISMSVPANESEVQPSQLIGPNGQIQARCKRNLNSIVVSELNTDDSDWHIPLILAKPWRRLARIGKIYKERKVDDKRSVSKKII